MNIAPVLQNQYLSGQTTSANANRRKSLRGDQIVLNSGKPNQIIGYNSINHSSLMVRPQTSQENAMSRIHS